MSFTHYPKMDHPHLIHHVCFGPEDPRSTVGPLAPGQVVYAWHHAVNFTRFYGSIWAPSPVELTVAFANDRNVLPRGHLTLDGAHMDASLAPAIRKYFPVQEGVRAVTDDDLPYLHYDALGTRVKFITSTEDKAAIGDELH